MARGHWWVNDPAVIECPRGCGCPIQRTPNGTIHDGIRLHVDTVHRGVRPTSLNTGRTATSR